MQNLIQNYSRDIKTAAQSFSRLKTQIKDNN